MEQTLERICLLVQQLTSINLENLSELSSGKHIPKLLVKIDPVFFKEQKGKDNWYNYKGQVEAFLAENGIDEEIDIDVQGIE